MSSKELKFPPFRIGEGWDVHALVPGRKLIIGGVDIPHTAGLLGHSDADVLLHAITDALLGAAALGDIGRHFPDTDPQFKGAKSDVLLAGHTLSRFCATGLLRALDYVRDEGKAKPLATGISWRGLTFAALTTALPLALLPWPQALCGTLLAALATLWLARLFKRRIGGYTGDCLGATQQLAEVAFYAGLLCKFS